MRYLGMNARTAANAMAATIPVRASWAGLAGNAPFATVRCATTLRAIGNDPGCGDDKGTPDSWSIRF